MTVLIAENPRVVSMPSGAMEKTELYVLNGQSWKAGELLNLDANGLLNECATDDDAGAGGIKYLALEDQTDPGNSTTKAPVGIITTDMVFEGNELNGQLAITDVGKQVAINVASNVVTVDVDDTTNPAVTIVDVGHEFDPSQYDATDTLAKVRFKVMTTVVEAANA